MENSIMNLIEFNNTVFNKENNPKTISNFIQNNKNKDIKLIIDAINNEKILFKYKNKSNKKEYIDTFTKFFNNANIPIALKNKYLNQLNPNDIYTNIINLQLQWRDFRLERKQYIENIDTIYQTWLSKYALKRKQHLIKTNRFLI